MTETRVFCDKCGEPCTMSGGLTVKISTGYREMLEADDSQDRAASNMAVHFCAGCAWAVLSAMGLSIDMGVMLRKGQYLSAGGVVEEI